MELVTDARVLVLDEPTSGLDAYNAHNLLQLLSKVATGGHRDADSMRDTSAAARIVFVSIHQPSPILFDMLDGVRQPATYHSLAIQDCCSTTPSRG